MKREVELTSPIDGPKKKKRRRSNSRQVKVEGGNKRKVRVTRSNSKKTKVFEEGRDDEGKNEIEVKEKGAHHRKSCTKLEKYFYRV